MLVAATAMTRLVHLIAAEERREREGAGRAEPGNQGVVGAGQRGLHRLQEREVRRAGRADDVDGAGGVDRDVAQHVTLVAAEVGREDGAGQRGVQLGDEAVADAALVGGLRRIDEREADRGVGFTDEDNLARRGHRHVAHQVLAVGAAEPGGRQDRLAVAADLRHEPVVGGVGARGAERAGRRRVVHRRREARDEDVVLAVDRVAAVVERELVAGAADERREDEAGAVRLQPRDEGVGRTGERRVDRVHQREPLRLVRARPAAEGDVAVRRDGQPVDVIDIRAAEVGRVGEDAGRGELAEEAVGRIVRAAAVGRLDGVAGRREVGRCRVPCHVDVAVRVERDRAGGFRCVVLDAGAAEIGREEDGRAGRIELGDERVGGDVVPGLVPWLAFAVGKFVDEVTPVR